MPSAARQVAFHQLLVLARKTWLVDALTQALAKVDPARVREEVGQLVPDDSQRILAAAGIRDEFVFPLPVILEAQPTLTGYYRLLLGISQKAFYRPETGMGRLKSMEATGTLTVTQKALLTPFCKAMAERLAELLRQMSPGVTPRDVNELPLLTLGSQLQGSANVAIGQQANEGVFLSIVEIVKTHIETRSTRELSVKNASGRKVVIRLSSDPDVRIQEEFEGELRNKVAIEIKGGTDSSNVHNRIGEAEKSHQKARAQGYRQCWTVISTKAVDVDKLKAESPSTDLLFDFAEVVAREGPNWLSFRSHTAGEVGIPEPTAG